ncbi:hypothetical protein [Viridibacillus arvi]|uniref:hypothetical protein n=1 Tax=Viridibacillus arvi TaxID=263475 RepID=UPI003D269E3B
MALIKKWVLILTGGIGIVLLSVLWLAFSSQEKEIDKISNVIEKEAIEMYTDLDFANKRAEFVTNHLPYEVQYYQPAVSKQEQEDERLTPISKLQVALLKKDIDFFLGAFSADVIATYLDDKVTSDEKINAVQDAIRYLSKDYSLKKMKTKIISDELLDIYFIYDDGSTYKKRVTLSLLSGEDVETTYQIDTPIDELVRFKESNS